jgi:hypothetical protein
MDAVSFLLGAATVVAIDALLVALSAKRQRVAIAQMRTAMADVQRTAQELLDVSKRAAANGNNPVVVQAASLAEN